MPETFVGLLRGINVGGKNKLSMADLRELFAATGGSNVRTFIQSGNVIFSAERELAATVADHVTAGVAARFGYRTPIIIRSMADMRMVIQGNPFLEAGDPRDSLHVMFLADQPTADQIDHLDPNRSPPDRFAVRGKDVYLCLPHGVANTKLTNAYFDLKLRTTSTGRNWRTVTKLVALMTD